MILASRLGALGGRSRGGGKQFHPLTLDGTSFLIDCKAAEQQEHIREVAGAPAFWTRLLNLANTGNSAEYAAEADQAVYGTDGGFEYHAAHFNTLTSNITYRTVIFAIKNNIPEYAQVVAAVTSAGGSNVNNIALASSRPDLGYGAGGGIYQGAFSTRKITTDTRVGDGARAVITIRNAAAPIGTMRYNGIAQVLIATGTNEPVSFLGLPTSGVTSAYRWRGTIYAMYCNTNPMSDVDISKVETWMRKRYNI